MGGPLRLLVSKVSRLQTSPVPRPWYEVEKWRGYKAIYNQLKSTLFVSCEDPDLDIGLCGNSIHMVGTCKNLGSFRAIWYNGLGMRLVRIKCPLQQQMHSLGHLEIKP